MSDGMPSYEMPEHLYEVEYWDGKDQATNAVMYVRAHHGVAAESKVSGILGRPIVAVETLRVHQLPRGWAEEGREYKILEFISKLMAS